MIELINNMAPPSSPPTAAFGISVLSDNARSFKLPADVECKWNIRILCAGEQYMWP